MGPAGSGKTSSLATFAQAGLEVFVIITEPTGLDSLLDSWTRLKLPIDLLHYHIVPPASPGWQGLKDMSVRINAMSYKDLSELKSGIGKDGMKQLPKFINNLETFYDERTGQSYGDVTTWGPNRVLAIDSLSGISLIALQHTVGFKPSPHQGEWGIAMSAVEMLILKLSSDLQCFFVLTAHIEKEPDEITGMAKVAVSTLGRKLAPKIPRFFSEVIRTRKDPSGRFLWSTLDGEADLKNRALPSSATIEQSFVPIVEAYRKREQAASSQREVTGTAAVANHPSSPIPAE
jgi:hypothetical protein